MAFAPQSATSFAGLLNDQATSDFTIVCRGQKFYVHKLLIAHRSEYFQRMLRNPGFYENDQDLLDLSADNEEAVKEMPLADDDPCLVFALLKVIYTFECPSHFEALTETGKYQARKDVAGEFDEIVFYTRVSELADRFTVTGVDSVLAKKIFFEGNNLLKDYETANMRGSPAFRSDVAFLDAISTGFVNSGRNGSPEARQLIAGWLVDHQHTLKADGFMRQILNIPELGAALAGEQLKGQDGESWAQAGLIEYVRHVGVSAAPGMNDGTMV
ncbi:MAG: hypothetical protein Q9162_001679 [Coniocarpon cinnabarinum]